MKKRKFFQKLLSKRHRSSSAVVEPKLKISNTALVKLNSPEQESIQTAIIPSARPDSNQFIIFLNVDGSLYKGHPESDEFEALFKSYKQEKGYSLTLVSVAKVDDIEETVLLRARKKQKPILIKTNYHKFYIYGDKTGNGSWGFTPVDAKNNEYFKQFPFHRRKIIRQDKEFNQQLRSALKLGHAEKKAFYSEYVYKGILTDFARFKAQTHFFNKEALDNLSRLIADIESRGMTLGIVLSSGWREFFDTETLKKLFELHPFSRYIIDKIPDDAWLHVDDDKKFDIGLLKRGKQKEEWQFKIRSEEWDALEKQQPILIKEEDKYYIFGYLSDWNTVALDNLSPEEQAILDAVNFDDKIIHKEDLADSLFKILKRGHILKKPMALGRAEAIELWLQQQAQRHKFLILEYYSEGMRELFPRQFIDCRHFFKEEEYQFARTLLNAILSRPQIQSAPMIQNTISPLIVNTLNDNRAANKRLPKLSMRVRGASRRDFLNENLLFSKLNLRKDDPINSLILDYDSHSNESWLEAQKWLAIMSFASPLLNSCNQMIVEYVLGLSLLSENQDESLAWVPSNH